MAMGTKKSDLRGSNARDGAAASRTSRNNLQDWDASRPKNYFTADLYFQRSLEFLWGLDAYRRYAPNLYKFGEVLASRVDPAAIIANMDENLPRLES